MQRPAVVNELSFPLAVNAIGFICGGALFLFLGFITSSPATGSFRIVGLFFFCLGLFTGIVTIQFRALRPWAFWIVKILLSQWLGMKGAAGLDKKLHDPEVLRAFGFRSSSEVESESQDKPGH